MKKLLMLTQDYEWYGNDEGTLGRWKPKGGREVEIATLREDQVGPNGIDSAIYTAAIPLVTIENRHYRSYPLCGVILEEGELTQSEQLEMDYEGRIVYGREILKWNPVRSLANPRQFIVITALLLP